MARGPKLLATGFGPFPGAPENPTEVLVRALAGMPAEAFGASAFRAVVLKTDYRRSWATLRRLYASFAPDVVVHFGLSAGIKAVHVECIGRNSADPANLDAASYAPRSKVLSRGGPDTLISTFSADAIAAALKDAGIPAALSEDAGAYVCNATLYRSLLAAPQGRRAGFVHVPPPRVMNAAALERAAAIILKTAVSS